MKELEGGTFTISNGGIYGSLLSTPILNPPQSGILGLHAIQKRAGRRRRRGRGAPDDVPGAVLRSPPGRRPRGGPVPGARQGVRRGSRPHPDRSVTTENRGGFCRLRRLTSRGPLLRSRGGPRRRPGTFRHAGARRPRLAPDGPRRRSSAHRGRSGRAAARRGAPRADRDTEAAAAQVVLRRARLGAVRGDHPPARVLPDPPRTRDPARRAPATSRARRARRRWSSSGSGSSEKTRLLLDALRDAGSLRLFMPFDVCLPAVADAAAALRRDYPGLDIKAVVGDFNEHVVSCRGRSRAGRCWSRFWAARSATSTRTSGRGSSPRCDSCSVPATGSCSARTWSRRSAGSTPRTTTRRA